MTTTVETALAALAASLRQIPALADLGRNVEVEQMFAALDVAGPPGARFVASLGDGQIDQRVDILGADAGAEIIWRASLDVIVEGDVDVADHATAALATLTAAVAARLKADRTLSGAVAFARDEVARRDTLREFGMPTRAAASIDIVMTLYAPTGQ